MIVFKAGDIIRAADINANFDKSNIKVGTVMIFVQREAPTYWVKQNIINDAAIRVVSGSTGGVLTGSTNFSTMFSSKFPLPVSGNMGETTLTIDQMPVHSHRINEAHDGWGSAAGGSTHIMHQFNSWSSGGSMSHSHSVSGNFTVDLSIKYIDVILCRKN